MTTIYKHNSMNENGDPIIVEETRDEILSHYWSFWKERMEKKYGKNHELITEENCLRDYLVVNWAWLEEDGIITFVWGE